MKKTEITGFDDSKNCFNMNVNAEPEKGKANARIIKYFSRNGMDIKIISGKTSKRKLVKVVRFK